MKDLIVRRIPARLPSVRDVAHMGAHMGKDLRKKLPPHPMARTAIGVGLIVGGALSFLPLLGVWMLPVGLVVLSVDFPRVRRWRRVLEVKMLRNRQTPSRRAVVGA